MLGWYSGEGEQCRSEGVFRKTEHHDRSRAQPVGNDLAPVRNEGLGAVDFQHVQPAAVQDLLHDGKLLGVLDIPFAAGQFGKDSFRNVVLRGSKTSGSDNYVIDL